jgi:hypothetical protein
MLPDVVRLSSHVTLVTVKFPENGVLLLVKLQVDDGLTTTAGANEPSCIVAVGPVIVNCGVEDPAILQNKSNKKQDKQVTDPTTVIVQDPTPV